MRIYQFSCVFTDPWEFPQDSEISVSNKWSKIDLCERRAEKSATFDPPNHRSQISSWPVLFKNDKSCDICLVLDTPG